MAEKLEEAAGHGSRNTKDAPPPPEVIQSPATSPAAPLPFEGAWMLLELVEALERGMYNAYEGSLQRQPFPWPVATFYAANRKVSILSIQICACHPYWLRTSCRLPLLCHDMTECNGG